jgi:hypothetical protein
MIRVPKLQPSNPLWFRSAPNPPALLRNEGFFNDFTDIDIFIKKPLICSSQGDMMSQISVFN